MKYHSIPRDNGEPIAGLFEQLIADSGQGDTFRVGAPDDLGRYLHVFELYQSADGKLVLVVTLLEDWNVCHRDGRQFDSSAELRRHLEQHDPCENLPPASAADSETCRLLENRYRDRCDRFLKKAEAVLPGRGA